MADSTAAPVYAVPSTTLVAVEYPGPVASTSQHKAIENLGGLRRLSDALYREDGLVELNFRPQDAFSHSLPAVHVQAQNTIVLRVRKRRRKRRILKLFNEESIEEHGVFSIEAVGHVKRIARFRSMADLQYCVPNQDTDPAIRLVNALKTQDFNFLQDFIFPEPHEDFDADLKLLPPPFFSRLTLPSMYNYKQNFLSHIITTTKEDGTEVSRWVNRTKYKGGLVPSIAFDAPLGEVPKGPIKAPSETTEVEDALLSKIAKLFERRAMWTRLSLLNQLDKAERSRVSNGKATLPHACYTFSDGPFRECLIRFGLQRINFRNLYNTKIYVKKVPGIGQDPAPALEAIGDVAEDRSHIFDGKTIHRAVGNYQLVDVTDELLVRMIQNEDHVRETCEYQDGWWDSEYFEVLRQVLRRKFFALLEEGRQLPDEECEDLVEHIKLFKAYRDPRGNRDQSREQQGEGSDAEEIDNADGSGTMMRKQRVASLKWNKKNTKPKAKGALGEEPSEYRRATSMLPIEPMAFAGGLPNVGHLPAVTEGSVME